ncbi:MAG: tetratricopeptide repeat protein [Polaromonas sp.]|uniref:O-linked N-acetylglucosamine transferase, SPINDLY family protein n=1 Tax=Polaromonas sp. TaxID=1869339 RepID=UPI0032644984
MLEQLLSHYVNNASAANARGEYVAAAEWCQRSLQLAADLPEAWYHLGTAFGGMGKTAEAVDALEKARVRTLNSADAQNSIGLQLTELGAYGEAEKCLVQALVLAPDYAFAHSNMGKLRTRQKRREDAEACFTTAIALNPDLAPAYTNLGGVLSERKNYAAAEIACRKATALAPELPEAWMNLGVALNGLRQFEDAESSYNKAIDLAPNLSDAWLNLGITLDEIKRYKNAADCYQRCIELDPSADFVMGSLLHTKMKICDWRSLAGDLEGVFQGIEDGKKVAIPFGTLGFTADLALQRKAAAIWAKDKSPDSAVVSPIPKRPPHKKIRIGYFSADYHDHATMHLMAELFESHDRERFELYAFSFGPDKNDMMRKRVSAAFNRFFDVRLQSDEAVVQLARDLEIDIAIDLSGFTLGSRPGIFSLRAAPVQVNYLAYPGTMSADFMDYLIADKTVIPEHSQSQYSEKIVYLPNSYQANDRKRPVADRTFNRKELGLPDAGFVFCCFNNSFKITPPTFDCWMRILKAVEGSVLWLLEDNPTASSNLIREALQRGIAPERLIFAKRLPSAEHLARHRSADLFLDTLPYNAHTTASDALWAGLPVLTCMGESFASRVAASLLYGIGLSELIAPDMAAYEACAIALATSPQRLAQIKEKLAHNKLTTPLFDTPLFVRHIEAAYAVMYERYQSDLPPDSINIKP